ncbi:hypothetical protein [Mesorhizobium sp. SP-1A]|uniref:hypothetical protein n=1 Tax=Mesorhizobium sp. SP-1A TaxID=3077840 RepID=UPI0028F73527|nr:hypothetical protein [Mesorhizobium sp. SP-1A]
MCIGKAVLPLLLALSEPMFSPQQGRGYAARRQLEPMAYDIGQIVAGIIRAPRSAAVFQTSWRKRHESPSAEQNMEDARLCLDERGVSPAISATCRAGPLLSPPALAKKRLFHCIGYFS